MIIKLKKENEQLKTMLTQEHVNFDMAYALLKFYKSRCEHLEAAITGGNIDFPNTEERGTGEQEQPHKCS